MITFSGHLLVSPVLNERFLWQVIHPLSATWRSDPVVETLRVPAHFVTDFASIPRPFWSLFSPSDGEYLLPAIFHDFLYESHTFPRWKADLFFREAMRQCRTPAWKCWLLYHTVHWFGTRAYNSGPGRGALRRHVARKFLEIP